MIFQPPYQVIPWHNCWAVMDAKRRIVAHAAGAYARLQMQAMADAGNRVIQSHPPTTQPSFPRTPKPE